MFNNLRKKLVTCCWFYKKHKEYIQCDSNFVFLQFYIAVT